MQKKRPLRVFLCHATDDKPSVIKLFDQLVVDGVDAWLDKEKLIPGQDWSAEIPKAVKNSDIFIVCLSSRSITKEGFVQKEIKFALDIADEKPEGAIFIIPVRLEDCEVPNRLRKFHWVDLFSSNGYERLKKALQIRATSLGATIKPNKKFQKEINYDTNPIKVVVAGGFSRGKTSFINALLMKKVLNSSFTPNTFMPTILRYGTLERYRINKKSQPSWAIAEKKSDNLVLDLQEFSISDSEYFLTRTVPYNDIESIEIWCNSSFLEESNIILIDTPGTQSILQMDDLVRQTVLYADVVLYVIQVDPGITEDDIQFVKNLEYVENIFLIINKIDT